MHAMTLIAEAVRSGTRLPWTMRNSWCSPSMSRTSATTSLTRSPQP